MRPWTADVAVFEQVFVQQEYDIDLPLEPRWIIDAGAHIGMASVYFANRYPKAKIVAIECNPDNYAVLLRNTQPYENITPIHAALWHTPGLVSIENPDDLSWAFRVSDCSESAGKKAISVRAITVPEALEAIHGERIDVLKMDIEGAEYGVLVDLASPSWLDETQAAILELHDRIQPGCTEVAKKAFPAKSFRELSHGEHVAYIRC
jgi:FkbM family methyltransferase